MWLCYSRLTVVPINQVPDRHRNDSFVAHSASEQQLTEERTIVSLHLNQNDDWASRNSLSFKCATKQYP